MALILIMSLLISCGSAASDTNTNTSNAVNTEISNDDSQTKKDQYAIGIIQLAPHVALDNGYKGFVDALANRGYVEGENLTLDYNNAQGDQSNTTTIAQKLVNAKPDLIFAIATQSAQAVASQTTDIPIVITAVTDAAQSGLVKDNNKPDTNVTGTSDLTPVKEQMELIKELLPETKSVRVILTLQKTIP